MLGGEIVAVGEIGEEEKKEAGGWQKRKETIVR